ncbi:MAG: ABC transporter substrate-binding protein [Bacteroidetes bacterium]|nr:ABC transporter substrate-binding protein [Bacteroidota bacterium]
MRRLCTIVLTLALIISCTPKPNSSESIRILSLKGPSAISLVHMMNETDSVDGKAIRYQLLNEPNQARARLLRGEAEFAFLPMNLAANLYNKGLPYQLLMIPVWGSLYLCGDGEAFSDLHDLKGKRVHMMARGLNPDIIFRYLLEQAGLLPDKDVILDYSFPSHIDLANAVKGGLADLAILSEPQLSMAIQGNSSISRLMDLNKKWLKETGSEMAQTALLVHADFAKNNPVLTDQLITLFSESGIKATSDIKLTAKLIVKNDILPDEKVAVMAIPHCGIHPMSYSATREALNKYLKVFYAFDPETIGGKIPDESFFYSK